MQDEATAVVTAPPTASAHRTDAPLGSITTPSGVKQVLCPPEVPAYNPQWLNEREQYLYSRGWEKEAAQSGLPTFRDPKGSRLGGEVREVNQIPVRGDDLRKTEPVRQMHLPPATYSFTLEEAMEIQRRRDAHGDNGPTPLERLGTCEQRCNLLERELDQTRARIRTLLTAHPISLEGLKLGLRELIGA